VIFSTTRMPARVRTALADRADLWLHESKTVDLASMLATLRSEYRVKRLVCEGGAQVFRALLTAGFVDELHLTLAPRVFGGRNAPTLTGVAGPFLPKSTNLRLRSMEVIGDECFLRYRGVRA
jgi:riboflavin biosynthesis pyrimidine reductase